MSIYAHPQIPQQLISLGFGLNIVQQAVHEIHTLEFGAYYNFFVLNLRSAAATTWRRESYTKPMVGTYLGVLEPPWLKYSLKDKGEHNIHRLSETSLIIVGAPVGSSRDMTFTTIAHDSMESSGVHIACAHCKDRQVTRVDRVRANTQMAATLVLTSLFSATDDVDFSKFFGSRRLLGKHVDRMVSELNTEWVTRKAFDTVVHTNTVK